MIKYFKFELWKYSGYRLKVEQSNLASFKKLKIEGFNINYIYNYAIKFNIDVKLIRSLKIKKLIGEIRINSSSDRLLKLLESSEEYDGVESDYYSSWGTSGSAGCINSDTAKDKIKEQHFINYQSSKKYNQRAKLYSNKFKK